MFFTHIFQHTRQGERQKDNNQGKYIQRKQKRKHSRLRHLEKIFIDLFPQKKYYTNSIVGVRISKTLATKKKLYKVNPKKKSNLILHMVVKIIMIFWRGIFQVTFSRKRNRRLVNVMKRSIMKQAQTLCTSHRRLTTRNNSNNEKHESSRTLCSETNICSG